MYRTFYWSAGEISKLLGIYARAECFAYQATMTDESCLDADNPVATTCFIAEYLCLLPASYKHLREVGT